MSIYILSITYLVKTAMLNFIHEKRMHDNQRKADVPKTFSLTTETNKECMPSAFIKNIMAHIFGRYIWTSFTATTLKLESRALPTIRLIPSALCFNTIRVVIGKKVT